MKYQIYTNKCAHIEIPERIDAEATADCLFHMSSNRCMSLEDGICVDKDALAEFDWDEGDEIKNFKPFLRECLKLDVDSYLFYK